MIDDYNHDWDVRAPVDDFGNEVHWSLISRGFKCGAHGWHRWNVEALLDDDV